MPNAHGASSDLVAFGDDLGLMKEVVVTGRKVGAGRTFYSRLAHNKALFGEVVAFVNAKDAKRDGTSSVGTVSLKTARKILGIDKVYAGARVAKVWKAELSADLPIRYSEADLVEAARENAASTADWRLVRVLGRWSLRELHARFGVNPESQPCFYKDSVWWLKPVEDEWATRKPMPGYYLLDFQGKWGAMSWDIQDARIKALGADFERADEAVLTEAVFTIVQLTSERLLEMWYHWGPTRGSDGDCVCVGSFDCDGLRVYSYRLSYGDDGYLRVVRSRKFRS